MNKRQINKYFVKDKWELNATALELYQEHYHGNLLFDIAYTMYIAGNLANADLSEKAQVEVLKLRLDPNFYKTIIQIFSVCYMGKRFDKIMSLVDQDVELALGGLLVISQRFFRKTAYRYEIKNKRTT